MVGLSIFTRSLRVGIRPSTINAPTIRIPLGQMGARVTRTVSGTISPTVVTIFAWATLVRRWPRGDIGSVAIIAVIPVPAPTNTAEIAQRVHSLADGLGLLERVDEAQARRRQVAAGLRDATLLIGALDPVPKARNAIDAPVPDVLGRLNGIFGDILRQIAGARRRIPAELNHLVRRRDRVARPLEILADQTRIADVISRAFELSGMISGGCGTGAVGLAGTTALNTKIAGHFNMYLFFRNENKMVFYIQHIQPIPLISSHSTNIYDPIDGLNINQLKFCNLRQYSEMLWSLQALQAFKI